MTNTDIIDITVTTTIIPNVLSKKVNPEGANMDEHLIKHIRPLIHNHVPTK